ncbi:DoxX family protein [Tessaracoccus antarcticus]|uniref:DoxX family protein n=2 Tax=Tessaracoccus antarcticus TaxID=2479848 RepID=A0A3M0G1S0_9ACTN|nr:DoxX family protein [Tessaracoccus antarcticus]
MFGPMSLLRFLSRSLFASAFIADGVKKLRNPAESAPEAEAFTARVVPLLQRVVPAPYSSSIPESTETWVRLGGAAEVAGGVMFATGIGRRLGAVLLAKSTVLNVAIALPAKGASKEEKDAARPKVLTNLALLGATLIAARDLQGRPSLSWRAEQTVKAADKKISATTDDISHTAKKAAKKAEKKGHDLSKSARKEAKKVGKKLESVIH